MAKFHKHQAAGRLYVLDDYQPYRMEVVRYLDLIATTYTGNVLLKWLNSTPRWTLIQPFRPTKDDPVNAYAGPANDIAAYKEGEPFVLWEFDLGRHGKLRIPALGSGAGSDAHVWYHPANQRQFIKNMKGIPPGSGPGEMLFHELIHAMRILHGKFAKAAVPANVHMDNFEEFCAITAANMYRSERGFKLMRASHQGFDVLDKTHTNSENYYDLYRTEIRNWFTSQRAFCIELARSKASFNPMLAAAIDLRLMTAPATSMKL